MIVKAMAEPITIEANRIYSGATIGIAIYGPDLPDAETMLAHADVALYRPRRNSGGHTASSPREWMPRSVLGST